MSQKERSRFILGVLGIVVAVMCMTHVVPYSAGLPILIGLLGFNFFSMALFAYREENKKEMSVNLLMGVIVIAVAVVYQFMA
ncbi:MAG: hypothetical protein RSC93_13365 [Erysipelotrichaceae bacterium]